jgi:hypothetical protein
MSDDVTIPHVCPACRRLINITLDGWKYAGAPEVAKFTCPACQQAVQLPLRGRFIRTTERPAPRI